MKYLILTVFLYNNLTFGQAFVKRQIPMVNEDRKVDRLLDSSIIYAHAYTCFNIDVNRFDNEIDLFGVRTNLKLINLGKRNMPSKIDPKGSLIPVYNDNLRYFYYKGFLVFVSGKDENFKLFTKTSYTKVFKFLDVSKIKPKPGYFSVSYFYACFYQFTNGAFQPIIFNNR